MQRNSIQEGGLRGTFSLQHMMVEIPDIVEYLDFSFYYHVSYKDNAGLGMTDIGRWIGLSHKVGGLMPYYILTQKGTVISRTTIQRLTII